MITARQYEDMMNELKDSFEENPKDIRNQMDQLNIETLACLGYFAGAKIYSEMTGVKLKDECNS